MFILDTPIKGDPNKSTPDNIYKLKWVLVNNDNKILVESHWFNKLSYVNKDGWDTIKWTDSINNYKDNINELQFYCSRDGITQLALSIDYSMIKRMSYCFLQINSNTTIVYLIGLLIETQDEIIEWLIDGNVYKRNIEE